MSGYRQSHDVSNGAVSAAGPRRPFNAVQWLGVVSALAGLAIFLIDIAGCLGWIQPLVEDASPAFVLLLVGSLFVGSRRHAFPDPAPELAPARRRSLQIVLLICAIVLGGAILIQITGAF